MGEEEWDFGGGCLCLELEEEEEEDEDEEEEEEGRIVVAHREVDFELYGAAKEEGGQEDLSVMIVVAVRILCNIH